MGCCKGEESTNKARSGGSLDRGTLRGGDLG